MRGAARGGVHNMMAGWRKLGCAKALGLGLLAAACSAGLQTADKPAAAPKPAEAQTPDDEVAAAREAVDNAPEGPQADSARAKLATALQKALKHHIDKATMALAGLALGEAEAEIILAAAYDPADDRVVALRGQAAETRNKCTMALQQAEGLVAKLKNAPLRQQDAALWQELAEALTTVGPWSSDFPGYGQVRSMAGPMLANWMAWQGNAAFDAGDAQKAERFALAAAAWQPDHPAVAALRTKLDTTGRIAAVRARAKEALDGKQPAVALQRADEGLKEFKGDADLLAIRQTAAKQVATAQVEAAKAALKEGNVAKTAAAVAAARQLVKDDAALTKTLDGIVKEFAKKVDKALGGQAAAAAAKGNTGAAYVKLLALQAVLGNDPKRQARLQRLDGDLDQAAQFFVGVDVAALSKEAAKELPAAMPAQVLAATNAAVRGALQTASGGATGIKIVSKGTVDATVAVAWQQWLIKRRQEQEPRQKDYLDRTEIAHNPAFDDAQAKMTAAMAKMNAANDELRPVVEDVNAAEGKLHDLQNQLADIEKKIAAEDAAYYKDRPMPCPDGTYRCAESWASKRWKPHRDYYSGRLAEENKKLETLSPKLNRLQAAADAAKKAYDDAATTVERTPRQVPKEIWLPYKYEVTKHVVEIKVRGELIFRQGSGKTAAIAHQTAPSLDEVRQDYATGNVIVKGQLLEPLHDSKLPEDATLTAEIAGKTLVPALQPVLAQLATHGERWIAKSEAAKSEDERVHYLLLAWRARNALAADRRAMVAKRLTDNAAYDPQTGTVDVSRLELPK